MPDNDAAGAAIGEIITVLSRFDGPIQQRILAALGVYFALPSAPRNPSRPDGGMMSK